jgi:hypothetical protein
MDLAAKLFTDIHEHAAQIIFVGEQHFAASQFLPIAFSLIKTLRSNGFDTLAIELTPALEPRIRALVSGDIDEQQLRASVSQLKDEQYLGSPYFELLRSWAKDGGELLFVNSDDPPPQETAQANNIGRDQRMFEIIEEAANEGRKVVALIGSWHTFIRQNRANTCGLIMDPLLPIHYMGLSDVLRETEPLDDVLMAHETAAEKLARTGKAIYSVAEILTSDLEKARSLTGLIFRDDRDSTVLKTTTKPRPIGGPGNQAPELELQWYAVPLDSWNAVFLNPQEVPPPQFSLL